MSECSMWTQHRVCMGASGYGSDLRSYAPRYCLAALVGRRLGGVVVGWWWMPRWCGERRATQPATHSLRGLEMALVAHRPARVVRDDLSELVWPVE